MKNRTLPAGAASTAAAGVPSASHDARGFALAGGLSVVLLTWLFPAYGLWPLAFVALAPWALAVCRTHRAWVVHWLTFAVGWTFFLVGLRWLMPVTGLGYAALAFYLTLYWALTAWAMRTALRHGISPVWSLPVVWVACEYLRAWVMSGFPWLFLAHGLYAQTWLIQISDITGAYGVSFAAALVNGLIVEAALCHGRWALPGRSRKQLGAGAVTTILVLAGMVIYGIVRTSGVQFRVGPRVAVVQGDFPLVSTPPYGAPGPVVLASYLALTAAASLDQPDLLALPESVWNATQNRDFLALEPQAIDDIKPITWTYGRLCDKAVSAAARGDYPAAADVIKTMKRWYDKDEKFAELPQAPHPPTTIVCGAMSVEAFPEAVDPKKKRFNSALIYDPDGSQRADRYDKIHLVPFGEAVPFRTSFRRLYNWLNSLSPFSDGGKNHYSLWSGAKFTVFDLHYSGGNVRFATPICYEDVMPYIIRRFVWGGGQRQVDFLVSISNDAWFLYSHELPQHLAICVFRAVENRVAIARAVNTGISGFIDPNGRVHSVVEKDGRRVGIGIVGHRTHAIELDSRDSFYGRTGDWFAGICLALATGLWLAAIFERWVLAVKARLAAMLARTPA
ncbi:Apolipoprotein N-acyltransferase [Phycisphaerae bacterium RAS1]|nr:Apolipoprotein N-acyltransferase [Phycisphaerae bacterium RAS1]